MKRKQIIDFVTAILLVLCGSIILIFPSIKMINVKSIFMGVLLIYGFLNLIQFILVRKDKDYEGLFTSIASIIVFVITYNLKININPWHLAFSLFIWIILMSLIKLKKADYYNDRKSNVWILKIITLILFILTGLITTVNLYYSNEVQVLVLGFFYLIHGMLELIDPITVYLVKKR